MLLIFVVAYLLLTLAIGKWAGKFIKTSSDFAIAGRRLPLYMVASGLFATWFGSETILGATTEYEKHGLLGVIEDPFGAALCLLLLGLFFAKPLYKLNILTFSDYFGLRYSKKIELFSTIFMIPSYFGWIAAQLVAMALVMQSIIGLPIGWGIVICGLIVLTYTYWGGMWSVSVTDTLQTILIIVGLIILLISLYSKVPDKQLFINSLDKKYFQFTPTTNHLSDWLKYFAAWITIGWGSIPQQDVFQRVLGAKNSHTAFWGSLLASFMYLTVALLPLAIILVGKTLYPTEIQQTTQAALPTIILAHTSPLMQVFFFGALLSAILSTCSGAVLAPATVVAENILRPLYRERISDARLLQLMRWSVILMMLLSMILASQKTSIYELVSESSALSLVALFVPLACGVYWPKATALGAGLSMLLGTASWVYFEYVVANEFAMLIGLAISIGGMVFGSLIKIKPPTSTLGA